MNLKRLLPLALTGALSIGAAFVVSLNFLRYSRAQTPAPTAAAPPAPGPNAAVAPAPTAAAPPVPPPTSATTAAPPPPPPPPPNPGGPGAPQVPGTPPPVPGTPPGGPQAPTGAPIPAPPPPPGDAGPNAGITQLEGFLEPFIYDIVNRRDPFLPFADFIPRAEGSLEDAGPQRALSPAQRWDLDQLHLIGIMWDIKDPKAMFLDPEQDVMILGRDESIGNRNGYVATIREGEVVVVEALRKKGDIVYRTKVLRIER